MDEASEPQKQQAKSAFEVCLGYSVKYQYFDEFSRRLAAAAPPPSRRTEPVLEQHFERDLNKNLAALFGRA